MFKFEFFPDKTRLSLLFNRTFLPAHYGIKYQKRVTLDWSPIVDPKIRRFAYKSFGHSPFCKIQQSVHLYFFIIEYECYG